MNLFIKTILIAVLGLFLAGCSEKVKEETSLQDASFESLAHKASGTEVAIYMWGGSNSVNAYMDTFVIPNLKQKYGVTLKRFPLDDPKSILRKVKMEKENKRAGQTDIIWINGENFKLAKSEGLLYGPFVQRLPNYQSFIDANKPEITTDFSEPVESLEAPWGKSQFVIIYNSEKVKKPPTSAAELFAWAQKNPGRFTYPAPPDFTGSAFVRSLFMQEEGISLELSKESLEKEAMPLWQKLRDVKPYMYQEGKIQPNAAALMDVLFAKGEIDVTFSYNPSHALNKIQSGEYPKSSRTTLFENASLANTHFLAIPHTAPNKAGAMVAINYMLSPEAQLEKQKPSVWGDGTVLSMEKLESTMQDAFTSDHPALLSQEELGKHTVGEMKASLIEVLEKQWEKHVLP